MSENDTMPAAVLRRRELVVAFRRCTWRQRKYLRAVAECEFNTWGPKKAPWNYNPNSIRKWLSLRPVRLALELLEECALDDLCVTARKVLAEYNKVAFSDIGDLYNDDGSMIEPRKLSAKIRPCVKEYSYTKDGPKVVLHDKMNALNALAEFVKLSAKRVELTGKDGSPLAAPVINIMRYDDAPADTPAA